MDITLHGAAKQLIQRLVAQGVYPNAESAVNSLLLRTAVLIPSTNGTSLRLPNLPVAFDEQFDIPDFPRTGKPQVVEVRLSTLPRLPDRVFD